MTAAHGTPQGYRAHLRIKKEPCALCKAAERDTARARQHAKTAMNGGTVRAATNDVFWEYDGAMTLGEWRAASGWDSERGVYA